MNSSDLLLQSGYDVRNDFGVWLGSLYAREIRLAWLWKEDAMPNWGGAIDDSTQLIRIVEMAQQIETALYAGFEIDEIAVPTLATEEQKIPLRSEMFNKTETRLIKSHRSGSHGKKGNPNKTEKHSENVFGQQFTESPYETLKTHFPAVIQLEKNDTRHVQNEPPNAEQTVQLWTKADVEPTTESYPTSSAKDDGENQNEVTDVEKLSSKETPYQVPLIPYDSKYEAEHNEKSIYSPLKGLSEFAAFFADNSEAIEELNDQSREGGKNMSSEKDPSPVYQRKEKEAASGLESSDLNEKKDYQKVLASKSLRHLYPDTLSHWAKNEDMTPNLVVTDAMPSLKTVTDIDDILEALTRKLQREYNRYYGF